VVSFPLPKILGVFDDDSRQLRKDFGILHDRYRKDRLVSQLATHLWELSWTPSPASLLEADAATLFLLARLNTLAEEGAAPAVRVLERFTARQQKIVLEYIEANLAGTIRNDELAGQVRMSVREFHGRFAATFGLAPHRFVMHRRVLKAKFLIEGGKGLAETSFECGFADQSHLTRVFKNLLGILPGSLKP
jgi:AraC family transcriptional regulator